MLFCVLPFLLQTYYAKAILSCVSFFSAILFANFYYSHQELPSEGIVGIAEVKINSLHVRSSPFSKKWVYLCEIVNFEPENKDKVFSIHLPCSITFPYKYGIDRPLANRDYYVQGILQSNYYGQFSLKTSLKRRWQAIESTFSLAEIRYWAKTAVKKWIRDQISEEQVAQFLGGLITGEFDDVNLSYEFGRFGLQHVMAISGFHFSIIAAILGFFFRLVIPLKWSALMVGIILSGYFLFLGISASILRSWVMISLAMLAFYMEKRSNALNSLGVALIITLLMDPLLSQSMGFHLSFITTAAILLLYPLIDSYLSSVLEKRSLTHVSTMNFWNQHGYVILSLFRQSLSLTVAVNLISFPLLLYYFHQFPLMSLLYNFFFPFLVSISMFLLLVGIVIPGVSEINRYYTEWVLRFTHSMPTSVDAYVYSEGVPLWILVVYLCTIFIIAIFYKERAKLEEKFYFL